MVKLNKPVKFPVKEEIDIEQDEVEEQDCEQESTKVDKEKTIYDRFDYLLTGLCVFLLLVSISVLVFSIFSVKQEVSPGILLTKDTIGEDFYIPLEIDSTVEWNQRLVQDVDLSEIEARSFYAYNPITHQVYFQGGEVEQVPIASIAKLLSVLVALENMDIEVDLIAQRDYSQILDWTLGLERGDRMTLEDALKAMLISSYNDAAYLVADNYPGGYDSFIDQMNQKAEKLGMENSNFDNPSGLDSDGLYSTSRDLKKLVQVVIRNEDILDIVSKSSDTIVIEKYSSLSSVLGEDMVIEDVDEVLKNISSIPFNTYNSDEYETESITLYTTNEMLGSDNYIKGLKTGYTAGAGQSFISYYYVDETEQLVTIILSADGDRFEETAKLVELVRETY